MADKYLKSLKIPGSTDTYHFKLNSTLSIGSQTFDGSAPVSVTIPPSYSLPITSTTALGGTKVGKKYSAAVSGFIVGTGTAAPSLNSLSTTAGKYYAVESDSTGLLFVNVPWTNTTYTFTNADATLSYGSKSTIATVGGTPITVTMPAAPTSSDTKVTQAAVDTWSAVGTGKSYVLFSASSSTSAVTTTSLRSSKAYYENGNLVFSEFKTSRIFGTGVLDMSSFDSVNLTIDDGEV